jgi:predicted nucleic acid-binding protein
MKTIVLDASVAAKWMLPAKGELLRAEAFRLLDAYEAAAVSLLVPDIFWPECSNIVWKAARHGRLPRADAESGIQILLNRKIPTVSSSELLPEALAIAFNFGRSVYDSLYVSLAAYTKNELVTADEKLASAVAAQFPVKWLGAF